MAVYINVEEGVKRVMNNSKFYVKMLGKFLVDTSMKDLDDALAAGDMEKSYAAVHTLKGLAGNLSLIELFNQSLELENQLKTNTASPDQISAVKDAYSATLLEVEKVIAQNG